MRGAALAAVAAFLSGCGLAQQAELQALKKTADEQYAVELAECARRFPDRKRGLEVEHRKCRGDASLRHAQALPRAPNVDLVRLANAKALEAAERYDAGKITDAQLDVELATITASLNDGIAGRQAQRTMTSAAQQQADAAQQQAAIQSGRAIQDAFTPKQNNTTCTAYGNTMNCRSY